MFNPSEVPRPDPNQAYRKHAFQLNSGYSVIEAEQIPFERDESWIVENHATDYRGLGYLRALRGQAPETANAVGAATIMVSAETEGDYRIAARVRSDRVDSKLQQFRFRHIDSQAWQTSQLKTGADNAGQWQWVELGTFSLAERGNYFQIAPSSRNVKIDRIVVFRKEAREKAMNLNAPPSEFHPWKKP
jgi:hypothetical protein